MKKFVIIVLALGVMACDDTNHDRQPQNIPDFTSSMQIVCINGVQYYTTAHGGYTPRLRISKQNGADLMGYECETKTETNDAAVVGAVSQM